MTDVIGLQHDNRPPGAHKMQRGGEAGKPGPDNGDIALCREVALIARRFASPLFPVTLTDQVRHGHRSRLQCFSKGRTGRPGPIPKADFCRFSFSRQEIMIASDIKGDPLREG